MDDTVVLTEAILDAGRSQRGGWSQAQLRLLGITGFPKGWKRQVIGTRVPREVVEQFLALKDAHLAQRPGSSEGGGGPAT